MLGPVRFVELRRWLGLPQEGMARLLICSFVSVNRWEHGRSSPTGTVSEVYRALDVVEAAGVPAAEVLGDGRSSPGASLYRIFHLAYGR